MVDDDISKPKEGGVPADGNTHNDSEDHGNQIAKILDNVLFFLCILLLISIPFYFYILARSIWGHVWPAEWMAYFMFCVVDVFFFKLAFALDKTEGGSPVSINRPRVVLASLCLSVPPLIQFSRSFQLFI